MAVGGKPHLFQRLFTNMIAREIRINRVPELMRRRIT